MMMMMMVIDDDDSTPTFNRSSVAYPVTFYAFR